MLRPLLVAAAICAAAIGPAPTATAEPADVNCIAGRMNADGSCYYSSAPRRRPTTSVTFRRARTTTALSRTGTATISPANVDR
jgi:hypothetical protein